MTLETLQGMNVGIADVAAAMTGKTTTAQAKSADKAAAPMVDPMQWWVAISQQFQSIAAKTMQEMQQHSCCHDKRETFQCEDCQHKTCCNQNPNSRQDTRINQAAQTRPTSCNILKAASLTALLWPFSWLACTPDLPRAQLPADLRTRRYSASGGGGPALFHSRHRPTRCTRHGFIAWLWRKLANMGRLVCTVRDAMAGGAHRCAGFWFDGTSGEQRLLG
jgi:hypothetical protein